MTDDAPLWDPHAPTSAGPPPTPVVDPADRDLAPAAGPRRVGLGRFAARQTPEVLVGAAFAGGFVARAILKTVTG